MAKHVILRTAGDMPRASVGGLRPALSSRAIEAVKEPRKKWKYGSRMRARSPSSRAFTERPGKVQRKVPETFDAFKSREWAASIKPQEKSRILRLPLEIGLAIWKYTMAVDDGFKVWPRVKGSKFHNHYSSKEYIRSLPLLDRLLYGYDEQGTDYAKALRSYISLLVLCRQSYLDVVGLSLLHKSASFDFPNELAMRKYLGAINPTHRQSLADIHLVLELPIAERGYNNLPERIPPRVIRALKMCAGLRTITSRSTEREMDTVIGDSGNLLLSLMTLSINLESVAKDSRDCLIYALSISYFGPTSGPGTSLWVSMWTLRDHLRIEDVLN